MKKTLFILALAAVLTIAFATVAFADHAPSNYLEWSSAGVNSNGPHTDYQLTTTKCNVCHAVHRAAVPGETITNIGGATPIMADLAEDTQMLLRSSVARSCNYCHMDTAVGGIRLWNGLSTNWGANWSDSGYGHGTTGCTGCHAVHGAKTFKGAAASKILRYNIKAAVLTGTTDVARHSYADPAIGSQLTGIQDEIFSTNADAPANVAANNNKLFANLTDTIEGGAVLVSGTSIKQAQSTAFCTGCHANYGSNSEALVNLDGDMALFGGVYGWASAPAGIYRYKNHPVGPATSDFTAAGHTLGTGQTVAWADASSCRACHDAGTIDQAPGVYLNSYPHVTPYYYRFMGAGTDDAAYGSAQLNEQVYPVGTYIATPVSLGGSFANPVNPAMASTATDGHCLKCHRSGAAAPAAAGVGQTY